MVKPLWQTIGVPLAALAALVAVGLFLLNPLFRILAATRAREVMTAAALFVVLGAALLMEAGGLSMAMGAFVAGVLLSESSFRHQLERILSPSVACCSVSFSSASACRSIWPWSRVTGGWFSPAWPR